MMHEPGKERFRSVVIWGYTNHQWLWVPLATELKRRYGSEIHFICTNEQSVAYWKQQGTAGVINSFTTISDVLQSYDDAPTSDAAIAVRARANEERYGVFMVDVLQTDRHLGRGFAAAGPGHPRSHLSDRATYEKSLHLCNRVVTFWEAFFDRVRPTLVIGNASGVIGKLCSVIARHRGIPMRTLFLCYYQARHSWAVDEYFGLPTVAERYATLTDADAGALVSDEELAGLRRLPVTDSCYRAFRANATLRFVASWSLRQGIAAVTRTIRGDHRADTYRFRERVRILLQTRADLRMLGRQSYVDVRALAGKPYVFFPLHVEPESSMGMMAPEMNEQLACVELLAKNLPAGVPLVVKEHLAAVGRRPRDFYATLRDIPNLFLVSPSAYALDIARSSRAVAVITGTLGFEAATLGVPIISFGRHNLYNFLPHVHVVESWMALRPLLVQFCVGDDIPEERERRRRDGRRFLAAVKRESVDLAAFDYTSKQRAPATAREVDVCLHSLLDGLGVREGDAAHHVPEPIPASA